MESQIALKEREISNCNDKLKTAKQELKSVKKKSKMTEGERLIALQEKITFTNEQNKEYEKELRMLKRQQNMQGDELQKLDNSEQYPVKLRQLMEEVRFAKDKQMNLSEKFGNEQALINRQREHIKTLELQL